MSKYPPHRILIVTIILLVFSAYLFADTPPDNSIPIVGMRANGIYALSFSDIKIPFLCELSWLSFDGVEVEGPAGHLENQNFFEFCEKAGMLFVLAPTEIAQYYNNWDSITSYWFRWTDYSLTSGSCFGQTSYDEDEMELVSPHNTATAQQLHEGEDYSITTTVIDQLSEYTIDYPALWFYDVYDEVPARQRNNMLDTSSEWDDWIPNMYTQQWDESKDPLVPALSEVEPAGIFSWQKYLAENNIINAIPTTINFSLLHTILPGEYTEYPGCNYGTMTRQAISVRAFCEAMYQGPPVGGQIPPPLPNSPDFICFDYYPFRYVDIIHASTTTMCDNDWLFLINHFEDGIDSTVISAREYDVPVFFYPQAFGSAGGPKVRDSFGNLDYVSYSYRTPAQQEFLMLCNLALLHQIKAMFPYSLTSYIEDPSDPDGVNNFISSSLLDMHHIPFDAPYEDWVYTGRWPDQGDWEDKYEYADPRELPPFSDGFDPLYEVGNPPIVPGDDPKKDEVFYEWLFEPYGNLFNSIGNTFGQIAWIAPEMYNLWWCSDTLSDGAGISYDGITPGDLIAPVIKVFEDESQDACYLFYVDRYCISNDNPYEITFNPADLPNHADCTTRLLDHSRRFIMDGTYSPREALYTFLDTLDAGEGRLLELIDLGAGLPADIRITSSDIRIIQAADSLRLETTVGNSVDIYAYFYNMGTVSKSDVIVTLYDSTASELIGTDTLDFDGLGYLLPDSCRSCDCSTASFSWTPDSTDIGVHRLTAAAATWHGEPDSTDNSVDFVFLVNPRDYATEVLGNSWDMTEGGSNDWHTADIEAVAENWNTSTGWTDSVSGMFEGMINYDTTTGWFKGEISLAIPEDSTEFIDTDRYHILSFGIVANNPNTLSNNACEMFINWTDSADSTYGWKNLLYSTNHIGNGWDEWGIVGPIDLDTLSGLGWGVDTIYAQELWLLMQGSGTVIDPPAPVDIRIGWVRLEESAP